MYRRFLVTLLRRSILVLVLVCLGCSAQSAPSDLTQKIERQVRATYSIPASVKILVGPLRPSDFANYDALTITMEGAEKKQTYEFLLSKDGKTLARMTKLDLTKDPYAEAMKKIDLSGRPARGNKDAKVVVVNFDDFQCPFCSRMHQTLFPELLKEYGDRVQFVYKDYPLSEIHPWATHAAVDANCLAAQNNDAYWDFADHVHANQREVSSEKGRDAQFAVLDRLTTEQGQKHNLDLTKLQACIKAQHEDAIKASIHEAEGVGVTATPTLFVNGQEMDGAIPISEMRATLDRALEQAGVPLPSHPAASAPTESQSPSK
jgi:protein-disulfide isomerase